MNKNLFETKIQPILKYIGFIGACLMCVAYIFVVIVLIKGFKQDNILQTTIFAVVNAGVGFVIMQFLKIQGISFAKALPENEIILKQYYVTKTRDKKPHSIRFYWWTSVIKDALGKCLTLAISSIGVIYIVIQGSNDYSLLLLALVNLIMFICFGLIALNSAYEFYNNRHIPYIKEQLANGHTNMDNSHTISSNNNIVSLYSVDENNEVARIPEELEKEKMHA